MHIDKQSERKRMPHADRAPGAKNAVFVAFVLPMFFRDIKLTFSHKQKVKDRASLEINYFWNLELRQYGNF